MIAGSFLRRQFRLILLSMLGVVLFQTMPTKDLPVYREHGSAFSAATYELALPARRLGPEISSPAPAPQPTLIPVSTVTLRLTVAVAGDFPLPPRQTSPPTPPPRLDVALPRAPPSNSLSYALVF